MKRNFFKGFKLFEAGDDQPKELIPAAHRKPKDGSHRSGVDPRMATLNIKPDDVMATMVALTVPPNKELKLLDGTVSKVQFIRQFKVLHQGKTTARIEDITGACDKNGINTSANQASACSPTHGEVFNIHRDMLDQLMFPQPAGQPAGGGMGAPAGGAAPMPGAPV